MKSNALLFILMGYGILSTLIFIKTTGGWSSIYKLFISGAVYISAIIMVLFMNSGKVLDITALPKDLIALVLGTQIIAVFFNYSDCGDRGGGMVLIEKILGSKNCEEAKHSKVPYAHEVSIALILIYAVCLFYVLWQILAG